MRLHDVTSVKIILGTARERKNFMWTLVVHEVNDLRHFVLQVQIFSLVCRLLKSYLCLIRNAHICAWVALQLVCYFNRGEWSGLRPSHLASRAEPGYPLDRRQIGLQIMLSGSKTAILLTIVLRKPFVCDERDSAMKISIDFLYYSVELFALCQKHT